MCLNINFNSLATGHWLLLSWLVCYLIMTISQSMRSAQFAAIAYDDKVKTNHHGGLRRVIKVKVAHTRLPSVGFRSWSRLLAVSLQAMWVINPAVGCHYFPPGLQLPPQLYYQFRCLVNRRTMDVNSLPKTVTRQRRDCDLNPGPSAPESSTLTTRLPSHLTWGEYVGNLWLLMFICMPMTSPTKPEVHNIWWRPSHSHR